MKKVKLTEGLSLKKETVSRLSNDKMANIKGGAGRITIVYCHDPSGGKSHCCKHSLLTCHSYGCDNS